jgi:hypothetical protein
MNDWLIIDYFNSYTRISHLYGDVTTASEGLQNLGLHSGPLSREGSLSCHTCCEMELRFYQSHSKSWPIFLPLLNSQRDVENLFYRRFHRVPIQSPPVTCKELLRNYSKERVQFDIPRYIKEIKEFIFFVWWWSITR